MDTGLLQGISEALKTGVSTYTDVADKKYRREVESKKLQREEEDRLERLGLLKEQRQMEKSKLGLIRDNDGNWVEDPNAFVIKKQKAELAGAEQKGLLDAANLKKTQAETQKIINETQGTGGAAPTQKLTAGAAENLAASDAALQSLRDVKELATQNKGSFGKGAGLLGSAASMFGTGDLATESASIDADLLSKAQTIGRYLEGGKLAESDIKRYQKMLPSRYDNPDVVNNKVATLQRLIEQKYNADLKNYRNAGFNTGASAPLEVSKGLIGGKSLSSEDQEALNWANSNSKDPRAAKIKQRLGQ